MSATLEPSSDLSSLANVQPIAKRLVDALGLRAVARLIGVDPGNLSNFIAGRRSLAGPAAVRLIDVEFLFSRLARVFVGRVAVDWLLSTDLQHGGARRIDILATLGVAPLLDDLDRLIEGTYA